MQLTSSAVASRDDDGRWLPGQSGNPNAARSRKPITDAINMELAMMANGRIDDIPKLSIRQMVRAQIIKACEGDAAAFHAIADRAEGKPKQVVVGDSESDPVSLALSRGEDARDRIASVLGRMIGQTLELEAAPVEAPSPDESREK